MQQQPADPWTRATHFETGQVVVQQHEPHPMLIVATVTADAISTGNPYDALPASAGNRVLWWQPEQLRHFGGCEPCQADTERTIAADTARDTAYWSQWDQADRDLYKQIMDTMVQDARGYHSFGPDAPVPDWMRASFDGHLGMSETPSLDLGRITGPLDWWAILAEHGSSGFRILTRYEIGRGPDWDQVTAACALLREAGCEPTLDMQIEMDRQPDGSIGATAYVNGLFADKPLNEHTYTQVRPLVGEPDGWPHTLLHRATSFTAPGYERTGTYTGHISYDHTQWLFE